VPRLDFNDGDERPRRQPISARPAWPSFIRVENAEIARTFAELADLMELTGGNPFKVRAYRQAAQVIDTLPGPASELWRRGELTAIPSIGERIAERIGRLLETGTLADRDELAARVPPGVVELLSVEGVGPKTVAAAWRTLGVTGVDALERACCDGRLAELPRMGERRARAILQAIQRYRARRSSRLPLHRAVLYADSICAKLRAVPGVRRAEAAGSVRRRKESVGDLDILVAAVDPEPAMRAFSGLAEVAAVTARGPTKATVRLRVGLQVDLRVLPPEAFGAALHYFTGSKQHNIAIRTRAVRRGIKLSEYGVFDRGGRRLSGEREEDVFAAVGLPWIPPELREGAGEIEAAESGALPRLVEEADVLGDLHVHSKASSDGRATLEELAEEAARLGRRYLAITDHSRSRPLGLGEEGLAEQREQISALNRRQAAPRLLAGVEVDILPDGSLDLPAAALAGLDWVVASVHADFAQPAGRMTDRVVRALRSGVVDVLGHPSGRRIGHRDPCQLDMEAVLAVAREMGVALEVNAMPERLDLDDRTCRLAKEAGVRVAISTDAHVAAHLGNIRNGVWVARRGWLGPEDVINTRPLEELWRARRRH
jgi:DNA polymerase (family 10)